MKWNTEVIARLRVLWIEGHSIAVIGRRLGMSKHAVVGKARREFLPARPSPIKRRDGLPYIYKPRKLTVDQPTLPVLPSMYQPSVTTKHPVSVLADIEVHTNGSDNRQHVEPLPIVPQNENGSRNDNVTSTDDYVEVHSLPHHAEVIFYPITRTAPCLWPIGEPGTPKFRFCGILAIGDKPYCTDHAQIAHTRVRSGRKDQGPEYRGPNSE